MTAAPRVVVLGGYGSAGREITRLTLEHASADVVVCGRSGERAAQLADGLRRSFGRRVGDAVVDASDRASLTAVLEPGDLLVVAASSAEHTGTILDACLACGADYLDIALSSAKVSHLFGRADEIRQAGICVVTDGGFHPGVPAALVRLADERIEGLESALVSSVISVDWRPLELSRSTVDEMMTEFTEFRSEEYVDGRWRDMTWTARPRVFDFGGQFGGRKATAMALAEMADLPRAIPSLRATGFYVGGFNPVVDTLVMPLAYGAMKVAPDRSRGPAGSLFLWGLRRFGTAPFGTVLMLQAVGQAWRSRDGGFGRAALRLRLSHPDAYVMTAAPVVATVRQLLDGSVRTPGVHLQARLVAPERFVSDLAAMSIGVREERWGQVKDVPRSPHGNGPLAQSSE